MDLCSSTLLSIRAPMSLTRHRSNHFLLNATKNVSDAVPQARNHNVMGWHYSIGAVLAGGPMLTRQTDCQKIHLVVLKSESFCRKLQGKSSLGSSYRQRFCKKSSRGASSNVEGIPEELSRMEEAASVSPAFPAEFKSRKSADVVRDEILACYELVERLGRGVVYLGSSRVPQDHPHFIRAQSLSKQIAELLDCTTWTGIGPGLMDAAAKGALPTGKPVGGFKIFRESGQWQSQGSYVHPYLPKENYIVCRFFSARKHGLVDAGVRLCESDRTAFVALPGGVGTLDEMFEILALIQLERLGSVHPVPFLVMNYDNVFDGLMEFLKSCIEYGSVREGEVDSLWKVCSTNEEALKYLRDFYNVPDKHSGPFADHAAGNE